MQMHQVMGAAYSQAVEEAAQVNEAGEIAIFVNLPAWLAPTRPAFALGHEGVAFWPTYATPQSLLSVHRGVPGEVSFVRVDAILPEMPYIAGAVGGYFDWAELRETAGQLFVPRFDAENVSMVFAGRLSFSPVAGSRQLASFAFGAGGYPTQTVSLLQAQAKVRSDTSTEVRLVWSAEESMKENVTAFVHLVDGEGQLVAQADGDPLAGSLPFGQWPAGLMVEDVRHVETGDPNVTLYVGLYHRPTGERLLATSSSGSPWPEDAVPIHVEQEG